MYPSYAEAPPKLIAGATGLDFVNTVEWRGDPSAPDERLTSYAEFVIWCDKAGLLAQPEARKLLTEAGQHPQAATRILRSAIALREATADVIASPATAASIAHLNGRLRGAQFELGLERAPDGHLRSVAHPLGNPLRRPLDLVAHEIVALLTSPRAGEIRSCCNPRCGWFFIDTSRNSSRRWCQMETCGNQAKARAHYARSRLGKKAAPEAS